MPLYMSAGGLVYGIGMIVTKFSSMHGSSKSKLNEATSNSAGFFIPYMENEVPITLTVYC